MKNENESDDLLFRVHYLALNENPNYPAKQLWQLTKDYLEFLNTIAHLDEITKIKIQVITFELLEKIVTPKLDDYANGSIDVPIEEIYGEDSHIVKKIYGTEVEKQKLLDTEKIKTLVHRLLYLPALLISNLDAKDIELIKTKTENETLLKTLDDQQEKNRKKIDNMTDSYIKACETFKTEKPTLKMLNELNGISKDIWKKQLANSEFLFVLLKKIEKKKNLAYKDKTEFWIGVYSYIEKKFHNALKDQKVKKQSYNDNVEYNRETGKKKKSNSDND